MTIKEFIRLSLLKPNKIWTILQNPMKKIKGIFFLLVLIISIPNFLRANEFIAKIAENIKVVEQKFPELSVKDGKLVADQQSGFLYRSDAFNVLFDPTGKSTDNDVSAESNQGIPTIAFLQDHMVLDTVLNSAKISYSDIGELNKEMIHQYIQEFNANLWMVLLGVMLFMFVYNSLLLYVILIIVGFIVRLFAALFMGAWIQMPTSVSKQLTMAAAFLPAVLYSLIAILGVGGGISIFYYLLVTTTFNWLLGMKEFIDIESKKKQ